MVCVLSSVIFSTCLYASFFIANYFQQSMVVNAMSSLQSQTLYLAAVTINLQQYMGDLLVADEQTSATMTS